MHRKILTPAVLALALIPASILSAGAAPAAARASARPGGTRAAARQAGSAVLLAAGDIGRCGDTAGAAATAALIGANPDASVAMLGDANGPNVSVAEYQQCYGPAWGQYLSRTHAAAGNWDLEVSGTTGYYDYFGPAAGPAGLGYYSYDLGSWHIVVLNSSCGRVPGGCGATSTQGKWLTTDLDAHPGVCTLAYWHRPLFTSGTANGGASTMRAMFQILYNHHADIVLNAHNSQYERFGPQTPAGAADPAGGIREFVVGTGGFGHDGFTATPQPNSEVRDSTAFGVLKLTLDAGAYRWQFLPVAGQTFTDSGTGACHETTPPARTLLAAGDVPNCTSGTTPSPNAAATAALIGTEPSATVAELGDGNNDSGSLSGYQNCYGPTWGKYKDRTYPAPGNHDYMTAGAAGYFGYWGARAGTRGQGWYSYDLGSWHIVVLNANCSNISGGCAAGSPEETWLRNDLAASKALCTLAYWHQPLFTSSASHPGATNTRPFWQDLYNAGAEIVLNGHNHQYERFAPQTPSGAADPARGIREFVAGTGGKSHYSFATIRPNSEVRNNTAYGVLRLTLDPGSYSWKFLPVAGQTFTDSGTGTCH